MKANKKLSKIKGAQFYKVGDKVEAIKTHIGAWFDAEIIDILPNSKCDCLQVCHCVFKLVFEGDDNGALEIVDRKLHEIRPVSYLSIDWHKLNVGMKVLINYNIEKPKQWGYWYDYVIENIHKRDNVIYLKGKLHVGYEGSVEKISVDIDSDNVADVLEIRPHSTLEEKALDSYETGVKPEYCKKCRNKPKAKCRTCCCCKCGTKKDFELTVQCDECADWYHIYCMKPPLKKLPEDEDWYCPNCNNETHRAKLFYKLKSRKQKQSHKIEKKSSEKMNKTSKSQSSVKLNGTRKSTSPLKLNKTNISLSPVKTPKIVEDYQVNDVEMKEIIKEIPAGSSVWAEVEKVHSDYNVLQVIVKLSKKNNSDEAIISNVEEYIKKDVANEHLWQEAKISALSGKEAFLNAVRKIFTCAICCELLNDPITLSCKHSFCIDCFFRSLSVNVYNCSLCRVDVIHTQHYVVNENLQKALSLLFEKKISKKN